MDVNEALEKATRILAEEQAAPTLSYTYVWKAGHADGVAAQRNLLDDRKRRPRHVNEDPKLFALRSTNFDLLIRILSQVPEDSRLILIDRLLELVRKPNHASAKALALLTEFMIRTGHLKNLLDATTVPTMPTAALGNLLIEIEEMIALNFNLFSDSELVLIPERLANLREIAARQTWQARYKRGFRTGPKEENPHYRPGYSETGKEIVEAIDGITEECHKGRYFYLKGILQELPNLEIDSDKLRVEGFLDTLGFNPLLTAALKKADELYAVSSDAFDLKSCIGHIRSFVEHLHIDSGAAIAKSTSQTVVDKWDPTLTFLRNCGFLTEQQNKFARGLYALLSDEGVHPLIAEREFARLLRSMSIEYGLMFLTMFEKKGIAI
jgi:hypothetical protein